MKPASGTGDREEAGHSDAKEAWRQLWEDRSALGCAAHVVKVGEVLKTVQKWR